QSTIQRLLSGETKEPRRSTLEPIARYYGFPVEAFFQGKPLVLGGSRGESTGAVSVWNNEDDLPEDQNRVWVDRGEYRLSAGEGAVQWEVRQKAALPFNLSFFQAIGSKPADCKLLIVRGDSMEPF